MQHHQKIVSNGDTSPPFPCCTSAEETGKLLFASCSMSKALNSTLEELKLYIMCIRCNRIHNNKQPGLHWVYLAYADSTQGLIGPWYWCRTPEQESFCWDQTLCDMQSWATVYFANFIYRVGKTQSSQIVHHLIGLCSAWGAQLQHRVHQKYQRKPFLTLLYSVCKLKGISVPSRNWERKDLEDVRSCHQLSAQCLEW